MAVRRLWRSRGPYDIINIHTLGGSLYIWLRKIFKHLPPCVIVSHGSDELRWELEREEERLGLRPLSWRAKIFYYNLVIRQGRFSTRHADHVITMAASEKEFYVRHYGMTQEKISVIPNGVSREFFQSREYPQNPSRLLYLGGWEWRKGTRYLAEAFGRLTQRFDRLTLSIVGVREAQGILEAFPPHARSRVRIIPLVEAKDVPEVYAEHDLFVFPTLFESIPLVIPEAMASGMPIVTTRVCGIPDILEDKVTALVVPPRNSQALVNSVSSLLTDPQLCIQLGQGAQRKARDLTWDRIAEQTIQVYERLLQSVRHADRNL